MIAPCNCKGTQKHVHRSCLDNWRSTKVNHILIFLSLFFLFLFLLVSSQFVYLGCYEVCFVISTLCLQEGFAFSHCTECRAVFKLRANVPPDRWWLRLRFQLLVARDHAFIFITVQMVHDLFVLLYYTRIQSREFESIVTVAISVYDPNPWFSFLLHWNWRCLKNNKFGLDDTCECVLYIMNKRLLVLTGCSILGVTSLQVLR